MNSESLPRLVHSPHTGEVAIEFLRYNDGRPESFGVRFIVGCTKVDLHSNGEVVEKDQGALNIIGNVVPTKHSYEELRDLLYPVEKDGIY